jgi:hypothetical protein
MGLSVASVFGYRNGTIPISPKGWSKLEQAERLVGRGNAESSANPKDPAIGESAYTAYAEREESGTMLRDEPMFYPPKKPPADPMLEVLLRIANALEKLVEQGENKTP